MGTDPCGVTYVNLPSTLLHMNVQFWVSNSGISSDGHVQYHYTAAYHTTHPVKDIRAISLYSSPGKEVLANLRHAAATKIQEASSKFHFEHVTSQS